MNDEVYSNFINNLKNLRQQKKLSQRLLSEFLGFESSYIRDVEAGKHKPSFDKFIIIANYFEVDFVDLFKKD